MSSSVAVVGSGVSGLTAAYLLRRQFDVTVFEADDRFGGHAHTHTIDGDRVDSGFIVHNDRTYPLLRRLFDQLDITTSPTEMSMSIHCDGCGLEYAGGRRAPGIFAQRRRVVDVRFLRLLQDVTRFQKAALAVAKSQDPTAADLTYGDFLRQHVFSEHFVQHYAIPIVACVWSSGTQTALEYPAQYLFTFLRHHGFLSLRDSPQWFTVEGGSRTYVDAITALLPEALTRTPVRAITRTSDGVEVSTDRRTEHFDHVVVATHADDALALLQDATPDEKSVLGAFGYSRNAVTLHRDTSLLPRAKGARASWNYRMAECGGGEHPPVVSYWMNRLQHLDPARPYLVTLNDDAHVDPDAVLARMSYSHPVYTRDSVAAQKRLPLLNTDRTVFAGAHHGWGFHEDGCRSGVAAAAHLGASW